MNSNQNNSKMSIYRDLIKDIKNNQKDKVYGFMNKIMNDHLNLDIETSFTLTEFKKQYVDLLLSFLALEDNLNIIPNYFNMLLELYHKREWQFDLSSYSLIIRILNSLGRYQEALQYLEKCKNQKLEIKNRIISSFFKELSKKYDNLETENGTTLILVNLFNNYYQSMLTEDYYYLLNKLNDLDNSFLDIINIENIITIINNNFIKTEYIFESEYGYKLVEVWYNIIQKLDSQCDSQSKYKHKISKTVISNDGFCDNCSQRLIKYNLENEGRETLIKELKITYDKSLKSLTKFEEWIHINKFEVESNVFILDGGNIGHTNQGVFSMIHIIKMIEYLVSGQNDKKDETITIIVILHSRHQKLYKEHKEYIEKIDSSKKNIHFKFTPYNENDDIYWLLSSLHIPKSLVITNDLLRDHHTDKLNEYYFKKWKETHLTSYVFNQNITLTRPILYTTSFQENILKNGFHIPIKNKNTETDTQTDDEYDWFCIFKVIVL
jgi:hypothetical protein